jgi:Rieske Fe-S protein
MSHIPEQPPVGAAPPDRRRFLQWLSIGLGAVAAAAVGIPIVGYVFGSLIRPEPDRWIPVGPVKDFLPEQEGQPGEMRLVKFADPLSQPWDGMTANTAAYVRWLGRDADGKDSFLALSVNCTHLGCPVSFFPSAGLFLCPCHGGVYYENGEHASGPPPRGLYHYPTDVRDGILYIHGGHLPTLQDTFRDPRNV